MQKYVCTLCTWEYNPEEGLPEAGIEPGTSFDELPEEFLCPACGADKSVFEPA